MRYSITLFVSAVLAAQDWQSALRGLPERAPADTSLRDVQRFEQNIRTAAPYLSTPQNIEANRQYVRQMWTYLAALEGHGANAGGEQLIRRRRRTHARDDLRHGSRLSLLGGRPVRAIHSPAAGAAPVKPGQPPFSVEAPDLGTVPPAEQAQADEMVGRYETAAARAAAKWQENDVLSQSLGARG
jgi:hypothetical protein